MVYIIKKYFKVQKVGHAGTLDPRATGLLIICTDSMTKKINEFMDLEKEYEGIIGIGATTKTYDTESEEENFKDTGFLNDTLIDEVRNLFLGETEQTPPIYSALKHKGKPLYKFAREGKKIEVKPRKIFINSFELKLLNNKELFFRVVCGKGTYIRTLANDIGEKLGCGGYLKTLRRTRIGDFTVSNLDSNVQGIHYRII